MSSSRPATSLPRASAALQLEQLVPTHESNPGTGHMGAQLFLALPCLAFPPQEGYPLLSVPFPVCLVFLSDFPSPALCLRSPRRSRAFLGPISAFLVIDHRNAMGRQLSLGPRPGLLQAGCRLGGAGCASRRNGQAEGACLLAWPATLCSCLCTCVWQHPRHRAGGSGSGLGGAWGWRLGPGWRSFWLDEDLERSHQCLVLVRMQAGFAMVKCSQACPEHVIPGKGPLPCPQQRASLRVTSPPL